MALNEYDLNGPTVARRCGDSVRYTAAKDRQQGQATVCGDMVFIEAQDSGVKQGRKGNGLVTNDVVRLTVENQGTDKPDGTLVWYDETNDKYTLTKPSTKGYPVGHLVRPYKNGETRVVCNIVQVLYVAAEASS